MVVGRIFSKVRFILQLHIICFFKLEVILHVLLPRAIQFKTSSDFSYWVEIRYEVFFARCFFILLDLK